MQGFYKVVYLTNIHKMTYFFPKYITCNILKVKHVLKLNNAIRQI